jgi:hypothetical protein
MTPKGNGLVELHDGKQKERGFCCMKLVAFLTADRVKDWEEWHRRHEEASRGECRYKGQCPIYGRSKNKL